MARGRPRSRLAKSLRCYNFAEVAEHYGVHRNTARQWMASGLRPIEDKRPYLFRGDELNRFHRARRNARRRPCKPGELYCLVCRVPRRAAGDMADYSPISDRVGTVTAICPACDRLMTQRVNSKRLARFEAEIDVRRTLHPKAIDESPDPV